ncbi:MAG: sulfatase-like hydrolase/transferase [Opitutaceae bacterium]|nr:sulfatase-like hydrolase/transferase [Opitutaceae bacterium]
MTTARRWCAALLPVLCLRAGIAAASPDVLILMPDQMRGDALSAVGHPVVKTPTFDALAERGALFRRAYSTCPSCIPARLSLLTGTFPATSGLVGYAPFKNTRPTLPGLLAQAGYATVLVGRNMHQNPPNPDIGYQQEFLGSTYLNDDDYDRALKAAAPASGGVRATIERLGLTTNFWQARPWDLPDALHPTAWIARRSRQVVAEAETDRPLFLTASFYAPHPPLFPPQDLFEKYLAASLPPVARGDWVNWENLLPAGDRNGHRVRLEGETLRRAQAGYFGLIEHLDAQVAPLIAEFTARSERARRPWVIILCTDHGELLGDHGYFRKCEPYEGSANIPFIIAASAELKFAARARPMAPFCLEDIMPTVLELAGVAAPPLDGVSLVATLRGAAAPIRATLHLEHANTYGPAQAFHALTDGRHKFIWRPADGAEQLFDLAADPREERNLAAVATHRDMVATWRARMVKQLAARPEGFSDGQRLIAGRPYPSIQRRRAP